MGVCSQHVRLAVAWLLAGFLEMCFSYDGGARAAELARKCLPSLKSKGLGNLTSIERVKSRNVHGLWTGMGAIDEINVFDGDGETVQFIAKRIESYKKLRGNELALVDHKAYYNEAAFYETDLAEQMNSLDLRCPRSLLVEREDDGTVTMCMTKMLGRRFRNSPEQTRAALKWLASLHALFWGERAEKAVAAGLSDQCCFWHLDIRHIELGKMPARHRMRLAAAAIDARLKADAMQTMCHGDPKGANIMWDAETGISFHDFQWFGKGPPSKDLAYFMAVAAGVSSNGADEKAYLRYYHAELNKFLASYGDEAPEFDDLWDSYQLAMFDLGRWMMGGFKFGNVELIFRHAESLLDALDFGKALSSEEAYRVRVFERFPLRSKLQTKQIRNPEL